MRRKTRLRSVSQRLAGLESAPLPLRAFLPGISWLMSASCIHIQVWGKGGCGLIGPVRRGADWPGRRPGRQPGKHPRGNTLHRVWTIAARPCTVLECEPSSNVMF
jgi:hypothetical protein